MSYNKMAQAHNTLKQALESAEGQKARFLAVMAARMQRGLQRVDLDAQEGHDDAVIRAAYQSPEPIKALLEEEYLTPFGKAQAVRLIGSLTLAMKNQGKEYPDLRETWVWYELTLEERDRLTR